MTTTLGAVEATTNLPEAIETDRHLVRSSERAAWRRCRQLWQWRWRDRWEPIEIHQALEFGTAIHAGYEAVYNPATWDDTTPNQKLLNAIKAFTECCEKQRDAYLLATSQTRLSWDGRDDYAARLELGTGMLTYYVLHVHPVVDVGLRPIKVEIRFEVPILDANGVQLRCNNSPACGQVHEPNAPVGHKGRIDCIMQDTVYGGYYILDWKTCARFMEQNIVWSHDQLSTYSWATRCALNIDVRGFILAEIRKDYPRPPARLQRRRNGAMFSTNKSMATTLEMYKATVTEYDPEGFATGTYDEFLEFLGSAEAPKFHQRVKVPKSKAELQLAGKHLALEVAEMLRPDVAIYPEPGTFTCPRCAFRSPCEMLMHNMDYKYTLKGGYVQTLGKVE